MLGSVCAAELFGEEDGSVPATFQVRATSSQAALTGRLRDQNGWAGS